MTGGFATGEQVEQIGSIDSAFISLHLPADAQNRRSRLSNASAPPLAGNAAAKAKL